MEHVKDWEKYARLLETAIEMNEPCLYCKHSRYNTGDLCVKVCVDSDSKWEFDIGRFTKQAEYAYKKGL